MDIITIIFIVGSFLFLMMTFGSVKRLMKIKKNCKKIQGKIVESRIIEDQNLKAGAYDTWVAYLNENNETKVVRLSNIGGLTMEQVEKGSMIEIYYDPKDPENVYSTRFFDTYGVILLCLLGTLISLSIVLFGYDWITFGK